MYEENHKSMMMKLTIQHTLDGFDRITLGIDVQPFGFPDLGYKRIATLGADSMREAYEKMNTIETVCKAFWNLENLHYLRPEESITVVSKLGENKS